MYRYNMFHQVHKGLKALLYETALELQQTDFWDVEQATAIIRKIENVVLLFEKHASSEDHFVFPAVEKYEPSVADVFEKEHEKDHQLGQLLSQSLDAYRNAAVITAKAEAGKQIQLAYADFMVFNLEHMGKEEKLLNIILWRYYDDDELLGFTQQIISSLPPELMGQFSKWMLRGLNNAEITTWLKEVKTKAPEFVFKPLVEAAEKELTADRFRVVKDGLAETAIL